MTVVIWQWFAERDMGPDIACLVTPPSPDAIPLLKRHNGGAVCAVLEVSDVSAVDVRRSYRWSFNDWCDACLGGRSKEAQDMRAEASALGWVRRGQGEGEGR